MSQPKKSIWTIGHSTRTLEEFVAMLQSFSITMLADVRHYPGSRKFPQYNKSELAQSLARFGIRYEHMECLGGRRKPSPDSIHTAWRHPAFRGYADYMQTDSFLQGIERLSNLTASERIACMCSEAVWWRCHRSMIADYLNAIGWHVLHIMNISKTAEHSYRVPVTIVRGKLVYGE